MTTEPIPVPSNVQTALETYRSTRNQLQNADRLYTYLRRQQDQQYDALAALGFRPAIDENDNVILVEVTS